MIAKYFTSSSFSAAGDTTICVLNIISAVTHFCVHLVFVNVVLSSSLIYVGSVNHYRWLIVNPVSVCKLLPWMEWITRFMTYHIEDLCDNWMIPP